MADRDEAIRRAHEARRLLDDPLLTETLAGIEAEAIKAWRDSEPGNNAGRELAYLDLRAIERLRKALRTIVGDGHVARTEVARENARKDAEKRGQA